MQRRGKKRYCGKSLGTARFAELLVRVYPEARFICLYRHPMDVIASGVEACPWGLTGYGFDPYVATTTPGNAVLAIARFWADNVTAIATPAAAAAFARVFPDATFVCFHRCFPGVLASGLSAYPFGLGNSPFWPYSGPHPGNSIATIAAYWATRTQALLDFEAHRAGSSCRLRYEDLTADPVAQASIIYARLGLDATEPAVPRPPHDQAASAMAAASSASPADLENSIPPGLRATMDRLSERLGYSALPI